MIRSCRLLKHTKVNSLSFLWFPQLFSVKITNLISTSNICREKSETGCQQKKTKNGFFQQILNCLLRNESLVGDKNKKISIFWAFWQSFLLFVHKSDEWLKFLDLDIELVNNSNISITLFYVKKTSNTEINFLIQHFWITMEKLYRHQ